MIGWIKLLRTIVDHWIWEDAEHFKAWMAILIYTNHSTKKFTIKNTLFVCNRGESVRSLGTWAVLFGKKWNVSKVRRFFKLLESDSMIVLKNEQITTRLTVCNYESYQGRRNADETQMKSKRNASETQTTTNKNDNNEKNDKHTGSECDSDESKTDEKKPYDFGDAQC